MHLKTSKEKSFARIIDKLWRWKMTLKWDFKHNYKSAKETENCWVVRRIEGNVHMWHIVASLYDEVGHTPPIDGSCLHLTA